MNLLPELPITAEDWEKTPATVQAVVILFWRDNQTLKEQVNKLQKHAGKIQAEVDKLQERVNKNSQNSSKPPSSDPPQKRNYPKPELSGEKKGGRKGHHGHGRKLKAAEEVSKIVKSLPTVCKDCGTLLLGEDPQPERHQVSELPKIKPVIVDLRQRHTLNCSVCGTRNRAEWPAGMPRGSFGERVQGLIGYLGGRFGVSQRDMVEMLGTVFQVEISLGSVPAQEKRDQLNGYYVFSIFNPNCYLATNLTLTRVLRDPPAPSLKRNGEKTREIREFSPAMRGKIPEFLLLPFPSGEGLGERSQSRPTISKSSNLGYLHLCPKV